MIRLTKLLQFPKTMYIVLGLIVAAGLLSFTAFCKRQGIEGYVYYVSGNRMPSPDVKPAPPKGIKTSLYIYELTNINQVTKQPDGAFYSAVHTRLVKTVATNKKGYFKVKLPPGSYSLFVKKDSLFYANIFDGNNNIAPVTVTPKKYTNTTFTIDYDAVY